MPRARSKIHPENVLMAEKQAKALELVKQGFNTRQVAEKLGYAGKQGAHYLITKALQELVRQPAEEVRAVCVARLDGWLTKLTKKIDKGDPRAILTALKIEERRAKLLGLDAPVQLTDPEGRAVAYLVQVPTQAATLEDWQAQARAVIDVTPLPSENDDEPQP